jgi:hypothetical protein
METRISLSCILLQDAGLTDDRVDQPDNTWKSVGRGNEPIRYFCEADGKLTPDSRSKKADHGREPARI